MNDLMKHTKAKLVELLTESRAGFVDQEELVVDLRARLEAAEKASVKLAEKGAAKRVGSDEERELIAEMRVCLRPLASQIHLDLAKKQQMKETEGVNIGISVRFLRKAIELYDRTKDYVVTESGEPEHPREGG